LNLRFVISLICFGLLSGCSTAQLVTFPYDPGGRSLNSPFAELTPRLSGRYLVFASDRRGHQDIYLYDTVVRNLIELPGLNAIDLLASSPAVSETGRFIVFTGVRQGRSGIYLYDRDTRQLRNLTETIKAEVRNPTITADGNIIAYETSLNGQWDIVVINRSGQPLNISNNPR
jgi:Tol biopolymer transport system component